jgi:hypothetical protein
LPKNEDLFHVLKLPTGFLKFGCNLKRFLKTCSSLGVALPRFEHKSQIQIRFVNATLGAASGLSVDGFGLRQPAGNSEQCTKEDVPSRVPRVTCNSLPEPSLGSAKFPLLLVKVAKMSLNKMTPFRRAESKSTSQSGKSIVVTGDRVNCRAELKPGTPPVGKILHE